MKSSDILVVIRYQGILQRSLTATLWLVSDIKNIIK